MIIDPLDQFITSLAAHQAHAHGQRFEQARASIADLVKRARAEYRDAGMVYGDELVGFLRWLSERTAEERVQDG